MFCSQCGTKIEDDWKVCPNCGRELSATNTKEINVDQKVVAEEKTVIEKTPKSSQQKKKVAIISSIAGILVLMFIIWCFMDTSEEKKELVQTGYLGNYDTVEVQDIVEWYAPEGEWGEGESKDSDKYIVEYKAEEFTIQFSLAEKDFLVTGFEGEDGGSKERIDVKHSLDGIYEEYSREFPEAGIQVDTSLDNDTLQGHFGPVKKPSKQAKNTFANRDFEELVGMSKSELEKWGLETGEDYLDYGALNGDINVSCTDDVVDMITITGSEKNTPSFHGVRIGMSEAEAKEKLSDKYTEELEGMNGKMYVNLDNSDAVNCQIKEGKVTTIMYTKLSEEELSEFQQETEVEEYIFPDSNTRYLSEDEVRSVEADQLSIGRNEIFARHGYIFKDESLRQHFEATSWYEGTVASDQFNADSVFNDFEKKNVELIKKIEDEINGVSQTPEKFIGIEGSYQSGSDIESGVITVLMVADGTVYMQIGTQGAPDMLRDIEAEIVDSNTAVWQGVTFKWTDTATITLSGVSGDLSTILSNEATYTSAEYYGVS